MRYDGVLSESFLFSLKVPAVKKVVRSSALIHTRRVSVGTSPELVKTR